MKKVVIENLEVKTISNGESKTVEVEVKIISNGETKTIVVNDSPSSGSLYDQYKHDKKANALIMQMANLYEKFGVPVTVGKDAVKSVLPPDI